MEVLFLIDNPLPEDDKIPLFPNTPYYNRPYTFPNQILFVGEMCQEEVLEVTL